MMSNVGSSQAGVSGMASNVGSSEQSNVKTKEYYVRVSKTKMKYHALKFHTSAVDLASWNKAEMARDTTNLPTQRPDWESMPKAGQGSEFNRENKELARRRKYGFMPKKIAAGDLPWIVTTKGNEKEKTKDKQYIGKKSISENSCYFVFIKCADGGFEAHALEDWYSFAPHKTYKTLNIEEAEEEFKRRHKILNKYMIMANKRKTQEGDDEDEEGPVTGPGTGKSSGRGGGDEDGKKPKKKGSKSSNLSDDEDEDELAVKARKKGPAKKSKSKKRGDEDDDEAKDLEDSDDGDDEGREKDYSDTGSENEEPEVDTVKYEEKYEEKGIDEEEAIKALDKSTDEESDEDEDLTEEGKEYRKLMSKKDEDQEEDEFDEFVKTGKLGKDEDSKDSSSSFDEFDMDEGSQLEKAKKVKGLQAGGTGGTGGSSSQDNGNKLKRKATDTLQQGKSGKKLIKTQSGGLQSHDESSSSSSASTANQTSKASKTAAIIAAAAAARSGSVVAVAASVRVEQKSALLTEEEVKRYLSRKPMTTKELLHKFRSKTQNKMSNEELCQNLKTILDKLNAKMIEQNGVKYLSLP